MTPEEKKAIDDRVHANIKWYLLGLFTFPAILGAVSLCELAIRVMLMLIALGKYG